MNVALTVIESPLGPLRLVASHDALVGAYLRGQRLPLAVQAGTHDARHPVLRDAARQLREYFAHARRTFDLPLRFEGTTFQRAVWAELTAIAFGTTRSYGDVATALGRPGASRAVGSANARNPISIIVPCHRVVGSSGALTGYAGGLPAKRWLLAHEARAATRALSRPDLAATAW